LIHVNAPGFYGNVFFLSRKPEDDQMAKHSAIHFYLSWAKERLDEMDATLASLEGKVSEVQADARAKANQALADMRKKRDDFRDTLKKQADANEAAWVGEKARLQSEWNNFEIDVGKYVESAGKQIELQQATFKHQAAAQMKAWREAAEKLRTAGKDFAAERRGEIEATVKNMEADAAAAEQKLLKVNEAGKQSWSALMTALAETRTSFDKANQAVQDAFKRAG
jgi:hypothetical protein